MNSKLHSRFSIFHSRFTKKSSALIITLLVVTLVATLIMYIARSSLREAKIVDAGEATLGAYYAAEAGLEDGLARLAADRNIEVPSCAFNARHTADPDLPCDSDDATKFNSKLNIDDIGLATSLSWPNRIRMARFGINGAEANNATDTDLGVTVESDSTKNGYISPISDPNGYYYDLKITSKTQRFGVWTKTGGVWQPASALGKERYKIGPNGLNFTLDTAGDQKPDTINWYWDCEGGCGSADALIVTVISTSSENNSASKAFKGDVDFGLKLNSLASVSSYGVVTPEKIKITATGTHSSYVSIGFSRQDPPNSGNYKPVYFKADIARLQSVGYYGGVKRRLEADVDRNTGGLINLFDFAVFSGGELIQPPD